MTGLGRDPPRHRAALDQDPSAGGYVPSRMPRALFVERFGDIFEHAADRRARPSGQAHPAQDTADGLPRTCGWRNR